ncbi:hypothetical protein ABZS61_19665 [Streptomyces sp. NPDC005566]
MPQCSLSIRPTSTSRARSSRLSPDASEADAELWIPVERNPV